MRNKITKLTAAALLFALGPMAANSQAVFNPANGLYYEVFSASGITWDDANAAANLKSHMGIQGHLATINSASEDTFVHSLVTGGSEHWVGGFQDPSCVGTGGEPGCGWMWVNGELISPTNTAIPYTNWLSGEPNDNYGLGSENHLAISLQTVNGWNDEGGPGISNIDGYIVEYGDVLNANNCVFGGPGCPLGGGSQNTTLPGGTPLEDDDTLAYTIEIRCDPRVNPVTGRCDNPANHTIWDIFGDGSDILPAHIKGSPCIAIMPVDASFEIPSDVVRHVQDPTLVPGIGQVFDCDAKLSDGNPDLAGQLLFTWRTDDTGDLIEGRPVEMTNGCINPSRGATFRFSTFYLNTHFDFCLDGDPTTGDPNAVLDEYIIVVQNKFDALYTSILNSQQSWQNQRTYRSAKSKANQARSLFKKGQFQKSYARTVELQGLIEGADIGVGSFNHEGNLKMRVENILDKVLRAQDAEN